MLHDRLADHRDRQERCYRMRFWWQLGMQHQEVTLNQSGRTQARALRLVAQLIDAVRTSHEAIDDRVDAVEGSRPVVRDRGFEEAEMWPSGGARPAP